MPVTHKGGILPPDLSEHPPEPQKCLAGRYFKSTTLNYRNFIHTYPRNALNPAAVARKGGICPPDPPPPSKHPLDPRKCLASQYFMSTTLN